MQQTEVPTSFLEELAEASGEVIRRWFLHPGLEVDLKSDETPVTVADREAEKVLRQRIRDAFPKHGIIGEEFGEENPDAEFVWILDPVDGTQSFAHGVPLFGTLIGLLHQGQPVLGCIDQPILKQRLVGDGLRTCLNGEEVRMRNPEKGLAGCTLLSTDLIHVQQHQNWSGFQQLMEETRIFRTWGDCFGYLSVASGRADIMVDPILNPWDLLPVIPVLQGAGAKVTGWRGGDAAAEKSCLACHPSIHGQVLEILNG